MFDTIKGGRYSVPSDKLSSNSLSAIFKRCKSSLIVCLLCTVTWGCTEASSVAVKWHNAYDIERELHLLGQEEDPRKIYKRLRSIKQQASLQLSQLRETGPQDTVFRDWLESLQISLSLAPLHSNKIETCNVWQKAMEASWGVELVQFNERAKLVWRVMLATCNARVRSL